jgi:hypothetical protein
MAHNNSATVLFSFRCSIRGMDPRETKVRVLNVHPVCS